ncbi:MAG: fused MFS/spermidine synthase [Bacteroidota bacterium]
MQVLQNKRFYFLLSFIEGGSVMATELLGAKMLAPYFGSSLYVWATVLAITLGGLASGYFAGGILSYRNKSKFTLFTVLLLAALFTVLMPFTSKLILWAIGMHSLLPSVILSSGCILFPPVFMMGMVSPLIIGAITTDIKESGRAAGAIYAISTVGGIIATFLFGFYIIPSYGLTIPAIATGILLGIIPCIVLLMRKKLTQTIGFFLLVAWACSASEPRFSSEVKVVYNQEGLLGQLLVLDYPRYENNVKQEGYARWLFVNRISQTMDDSLAMANHKDQRYFPYVYHISNYLDSFPKTTKVLLMGLGGGSIAKQLFDQGFSVDVCELDERIAYVARHYFHLNEKVNITVDDARHYIRTCDKKYDVIVLDMFKGEEPPNHVFTREAMDELKLMLNKNGTVFVNGLGYYEGSIGKAMRSVYKTFGAAGFKVRAEATDKNPDMSNLLFYASLDSLKTNVPYLPESKLDLNDAVVLTDDYPLLDKLNAEAAKRWRMLSINSFREDAGQYSLPIFN